jgi:hypothetical protein
MSILTFPRINFRGVFRTNPCTSNNDDVMPSVVERDSDTLGATLTGMTDAQVMTYLREQVAMSNAPGGACTNFIRAGWNLYGDHSTAFDSAVVTSIVYGASSSQRITSPTDDPLINQPVLLLGSVSNDPQRRGSAILCDLDPTGLVTTQLWNGGLQIGSGGPDGTDPSQIVAQFNHDTRAFQNWLNFFSTIAPSAQPYGGEQNFVGIGCVMQFAIPASAIPASVSFNSPGLQKLLSIARGTEGLVVRFRCFEVQPGITDENLYAAFQQGQALENPALGYLIGTIGLWQDGEPETETAGRKLMCHYPRPAMKYQEPGGTVVPWPKQPKPWTPKLPPALVGNAVVQVEQSPPVISIDLIESFPKFGFRDPDGPQKPTSGGFAAARQKANFGPVQLAVLPPDGGPATPIAVLDYGLSNYSTYEDFGGIVDVTYDPTQYPLIASGALVLQGTTANTLNPGTTLLKESSIRVVTDDRTMYLVPGQTNAQARIKVYESGGPTTFDVTLYLYEYANIIEQQTGTCADGSRPNQTVASESPGILNFPSTVTIPAGQGYSDWFLIPITPAQSGATILSYQLSPTMFGQSNPNGVTGVPVWSYADYSSIRVYENEDFSALYANGPLQWADVYASAIRYYYLLFPAMSTYIPLNLEDSITQHAALISTRLNAPADPGFYTTYNMPLTRTMSPAKVKLILDFLAQQPSAQRQTT